MVTENIKIYGIYIYFKNDSYNREMQIQYIYKNLY
jgi:hypothetical protein